MPNAASNPLGWWQRARGSAVIFAAAGTVVRLGSSLILLPLILLRLTPNELAVWWVFESLGSFALVADFGFGQVISRSYSFLWGGASDIEVEGLRPSGESKAPNLPKVRALNATVRRFYLKLALGAMLLLALCGTGILVKPIAAMGGGATPWIAWTVFLLVTGYNLGKTHWLLAAQGVNRVREVQQIWFWSSLVYLFSTALLLVFGAGLWAMVGGAAVRTLLNCRLFRRAYLGAVPSEGITVSDPSLLSRLWPNAWRIGLLSLGGFFLSNATVFVSSQILLEHTDSIGLTNKVGIVLSNLAAVWLTVKWPELAMLRTQGRLMEMSHLFARRLGLVAASFVAASVLVILCGNGLLQWKSTPTRLLPLPLLVIYFAYLTHQLIYVSFANLTLTENVVPFFRLSLFVAAAVYLLCFLLTPAWGLWGLVAAPVIGEFCISGWQVMRRGFQSQTLNLQAFVQSACGVGKSVNPYS